MFQPIHKDLGHNFIDFVAKTYWPIVVYGFRSELFRNESNQSLIGVFKDFLLSKIFFNFKSD